MFTTKQQVIGGDLDKVDYEILIESCSEMPPAIQFLRQLCSHQDIKLSRAS